MPNRKEGYHNMEKFKKTRQLQKRRYYRKTSNLYIGEKRHWTYEEEKMVLEHSISDSELSAILNRSVGAIQSRRSILKKRQKNNGE